MIAKGKAEVKLDRIKQLKKKFKEESVRLNNFITASK